MIDFPVGLIKPVDAAAAAFFGWGVPGAGSLSFSMTAPKSEPWGWEERFAAMVVVN